MACWRSFWASVLLGFTCRHPWGAWIDWIVPEIGFVKGLKTLDFCRSVIFMKFDGASLWALISQNEIWCYLAHLEPQGLMQRFQPLSRRIVQDQCLLGLRVLHEMSRSRSSFWACPEQELVVPGLSKHHPLNWTKPLFSHFLIYVLYTYVNMLLHFLWIIKHSWKSILSILSNCVGNL